MGDKEYEGRNGRLVMLKIDKNEGEGRAGDKDSED